MARFCGEGSGQQHVLTKRNRYARLCDKLAAIAWKRAMCVNVTNDAPFCRLVAESLFP